MRNSETWCGVCDADTEHIGAVCVPCGCVTPLCPECEQPLLLMTDQEEDDGKLNWACEPCGIDYSRWQFPVPKRLADEQRKAIQAELHQMKIDEDRDKFAEWNRVMGDLSQ